MPAAPHIAALPNDPSAPSAPAADSAPPAPAADSAPPAPAASRAICDSQGELPADSPPAAASAPAPPGANRVLNLLRKLIDYGQDLVRTVQQRAAAGTLLTLALRFGTKDVALILARITRGLQLAGALEARLVSHPVRPAAAAHAPRARHTARPKVQRPSLPDLPTAQEIAAALRHRPAAAVIADICRDLGIVPAHPLWRELMLVLSGPGGNFVKFFKDVHRATIGLRDPAALGAHESPALGSHPVALCATGPP